MAADEDDLPFLEVPSSLYQRSMEVARGGMGRIVVARDRRLRRWVAVKELLDSSVDSRRFEREALITAKLQHPNIVRVYEAGLWPSGEPFYAMEMVRGLSLDVVIGQKKTLDDRLALLPNVIATADALAYAHSQRIIHRDLKPGNILVGNFGETVVIDWGLAKDLDQVSELPSQPSQLRPQPDGLAADTQPDPLPATDEADSKNMGSLTQVGSVLGTPTYMPPEQARGDTVDERADVYAIGAILYSVLTGRAPYRGRSSEDVLVAVLSGPPATVESLAPAAPPDLCAVVRRAMAASLDDRYPTASELAADLRRFQTGQLVKAHHYSRAQILRRWARRNRAVLLVIGSALALLATIGAFSVRRIVVERDRANEARRSAVDARTKAEAAEHRALLRADELMLSQARQALDKDPSLSLAWLKELTAASTVGERVRTILEEAVRRGVSRVLRGHTDDIDYLRYAPDGKGIASGSDDRTVRLWSLPDGQSRLLAGHTGKVHALAWSPDGHTVASGSVDQTVRLWDFTSGDSRTLIGHRGTVRSIAFSPDGTILITGSQDKTLRAWQLPVGTPLWTVPHSDELRGVAFSPDGTLVASCTADGKVGIWDAHTGKGQLLVGKHAIVRLVRFSPDSKLLVSAGEDNEIHIWDVATHQSRTLKGHEDVVKDVAFSPDGHLLVSVSQDRMVRLWQVATGHSQVLGEHTGGIKAVVFSPDGRRVASGGSDQVIRVFDLEAGGAPRLLRGHSAAVKALAFSPDSHSLASSSDDDSVRWWPLERVTLPGADAPAAELRAFLDRQTNLTVAAEVLPIP